MLDLDDVVYPFSRAMYTELVVHWNLTKDFFEFWEDAENQYSYNMWDNLVRIESVYSAIPMKKEDMDLIKKLAEKFDIFYITSRPKEVELATRNYLKRFNFPCQENLIFTRDKGLVCNSIGITLAVEDMLHNIKNLIKCGIPTVMMVQPWNRKELQNLEPQLAGYVYSFQELNILL